MKSNEVINLNHFIQKNDYFLLCKDEDEFSRGRFSQVIEVISIEKTYVTFKIDQPKCNLSKNQLNHLMDRIDQKAILVYPNILDNKKNK